MPQALKKGFYEESDWHNPATWVTELDWFRKNQTFDNLFRERTNPSELKQAMPKSLGEDFMKALVHPSDNHCQCVPVEDPSSKQCCYQPTSR